jgi:hypothetical protein
VVKDIYFWACFKAFYATLRHATSCHMTAGAPNIVRVSRDVYILHLYSKIGENQLKNSGQRCRFLVLFLSFLYYAAPSYAMQLRHLFIVTKHKQTIIKKTS